MDIPNPIRSTADPSWSQQKSICSRRDYLGPRTQHVRKIHNGYVYAKVKKAWYGLKQSGRIAHDDLEEHLAKKGYHKTRTEGLFKHETRDLAFTLVVNNFAIKYTKKEDADHLINWIKEKYTNFKVDWEAKQYIGIKLVWDYVKRTVKLHMKGYMEQALKELEHPSPKQKYHSPSRMLQSNFGQKIQYVKLDHTDTNNGHVEDSCSMPEQ